MNEGMWDFRPERRAALATRVMAALRTDPRVKGVALFGSLASSAEDGYPADGYSDIDIEVHVRDATDRAFFLDLPPILGQVGPILIQGASVEEDRYIAHAWFEGYPLFWHVDIACIATERADGADIAEATHWERTFGLWLLAVKRVRRAADTLELVRAALGIPRAVRTAPDAGLDDLSALLEAWRATGAAEGKPYTRTYALGRELLERLFR